MKAENYTNLLDGILVVISIFVKKNKDLDFRLIELNPNYELLKEQVRENLLSPNSIEIKINRNI